MKYLPVAEAMDQNSHLSPSETKIGIELERNECKGPTHRVLKTDISRFLETFTINIARIEESWHLCETVSLIIMKSIP